MSRTSPLLLLMLTVALLAGCDDPPEHAAPQADSAPDLELLPDSGPDSGPLPDQRLDQLPSPDRGRPDLGALQLDASADADPRPWALEIVDDSPKFKSRTDVAALADGPRLAYNIATSDDGLLSPEIWRAAPQPGGWDRQQVVAAEGVSREFPTLIVDGQGRLHLFYNSWIEQEEQIEIFHVVCEDASSCGEPVNVTNSPIADEYAPDVALDGFGTFHLLFMLRKGGQNGVGYLRVSGDVATPVEVVDSPVPDFSLSPDYAIGVSRGGEAYAVYAKAGLNPYANTLYLRRRDSAWHEAVRVSNPTQDAWSPAVAVDGSDVVHIAFAYGASWGEKTMTYNRFADGALLGEQALTSSTADRSYYLGMAAEPNGTVYIAFSRYFEIATLDQNNGDIFMLKGRDGVFFPEERITETDELDEGNPAIAVGPDNALYVSFVENIADFPNGVVYLASKRSPAAP